MDASRSDVVRAVRNLGQRDSVFQFPGLREKLGIAPDDKNGASQLHNLLKRLIAMEAVEIVPGKRERNRYYRIKNEEKLREFAPVVAVSTDSGAPRAAGAADRLGRIEDRLGRLEAAMQANAERLEARLAELISVWT